MAAKIIEMVVSIVVEFILGAITNPKKEVKYYDAKVPIHTPTYDDIMGKYGGLLDKTG